MSKLLQLVFCFIINIFSSISIIQVNKYIYINYGFSNLVLTCLQFAITSACLFLCSKFQMIKTVRIPIFKMIRMSLAFCGFVLLTNYSLQFNSIGTYQCLKALTTPGVLLISHFVYSKTYSLKINLTTVILCRLANKWFFFKYYFYSFKKKVPVLLGIVFNSLYDLKYNFYGLNFGLFGAIVSSFYQVVI